MKVLEYILDYLPILHYQLLIEAKENLLLYMGYCVMVKNQRDAIDKIMNDLKPNQVVLLIDFKMKFETKYY